MKIEIDRIDLTENKTDLPGKWFQERDNPHRARADMLSLPRGHCYPLAPLPMIGATITDEPEDVVRADIGMRGSWTNGTRLHHRAGQYG
jgi:hypothetical protein